MSGFFSSSSSSAAQPAPAALRRCAARINGMPCRQICESPLSIFCNEHIPGFVQLPQQQTYGRCTHFDSTGRICQNQITSPNTPFCVDHRPPFMMPVQHMMPMCTHTENGICCASRAAVIPNNYGHSFIGVPWPLCEAHALPHIYYHFTGAVPPSPRQYQQHTPLFSREQLQNTQAHLQSFLAVPPPQQIQQLPRVQQNIDSVSNNEPQVDDAEKPTCSICTDTITVPYSGAVNGAQQCDLHCRHAFHAKCLDQWFCSLRVQERTPTCPNCRAQVNRTDYCKVRQACTLAILIDDFDVHVQPNYDDDDDEFINTSPVNAGDVFFRGHHFHVVGLGNDSDSDSDYEVNNIAPRNLLDSFNEVAGDDLDASAIAQQAFNEVVGVN